MKHVQQFDFENRTEVIEQRERKFVQINAIVPMAQYAAIDYIVLSDFHVGFLSDNFVRINASLCQGPTEELWRFDARIDKRKEQLESMLGQFREAYEELIRPVKVRVKKANKGRLDDYVDGDYYDDED